jgi:class 3 adenylate cyclase/DNA-binding SARP family transcriptional activator
MQGYDRNLSGPGSVMQKTPDRSILKAVLFADLHQYSRLVAHDEIKTLSFVQDCFQMFKEECSSSGGEFIKTTGDGVLILFDSATAAVEYAMRIQQRLRDRVGSENQPRFRIGLHMGEVFRRDGDVFGHAVNVAARLEGLAEPGGICVSQDVYSAAHQGSACEFKFGGRASLKNIPEPITIYHVVASSTRPQDRSDIRVVITTIDGLSMFTDSGDSLPLKSDKARALIGFLALSTRSQDSQDRLAAMLWPTRNLPEARQALTRCVGKVERILSQAKFAVLSRQGDFLSLNPAWTEIDLLAILRDLASGKVNELLLERSDWSEAILFGLEDVSPVFNSWLKVSRRNWQDKIAGLLEAMLERFQATEPQVRLAASALLLAEPCHERAAQSLMRHYAAIGNRSAASRVYDLLAREMRERFSIEPGADTTKLLKVSLNPTGSTALPADPVLGRARRPAIAIGEFVARSPALSDSTFGFRADLIANLSRFREWAILEAIESQGAPGCDYEVSGTCTEHDQQTELFVLLRRPESGQVIWSEKFLVSAVSWAELQRNLVSRIASSLEIYVSHDRLTRTLADHAHPDAYDIWVKGEHLLTHWKAADEDAAALLFEQVIARDPNFAPAYSSLSSVLSSRHLTRPGVRPSPDVTQRALELGNRAIELDPLSARAQLNLAWVLALCERYSQAEVHYDLAAELNPCSPKMLISAALGLAFMGYAATAKMLMDRSVALSPLLLDYQWSYVATIKYLIGDYQGAIIAADRSNNVIVDTPGWAAAAWLQLGHPDKARAAVTALVELVAADWHGEASPTRQTVLDWFLAAFPMRRGEDRTQLGRVRELV